MNFKIFFSVFFLASASCGNLKKTGGICGKIIHKDRLYNKEGNEVPGRYAEKDLVIWFEDSTVIIEKSMLHIITDVNNKETSFNTVIGYTYLNMKNMIFYDYGNFSDTSVLLRKYTIPDSAIVGWNFYRKKSLVPFSNEMIPAVDTLINNVSYKRLTGKTVYTDEKGKSETTFYTYYMRCDKKNSIFHVDRVFDEKVNVCPATRCDFMSPDQNRFIISTGYEFVADTLTPFEQKIFKKWADNAAQTKLPLQKM